MEIYKSVPIGELIHDNSYVGRGIVIGKSEDGKKAAVAYFIMGRSENSRNPNLSSRHQLQTSKRTSVSKTRCCLKLKNSKRAG